MSSTEVSDSKGKFFMSNTSKGARQLPFDQIPNWSASWNKPWRSSMQMKSAPKSEINFSLIYNRWRAVLWILCLYSSDGNHGSPKIWELNGIMKSYLQSYLDSTGLMSTLTWTLQHFIEEFARARSDSLTRPVRLFPLVRHLSDFPTFWSPSDFCPTFSVSSFSKKDNVYCLFKSLKIWMNLRTIESVLTTLSQFRTAVSQQRWLVQLQTTLYQVEKGVQTTGKITKKRTL